MKGPLGLMVVEFFKTFWKMIGPYYHKMICQSLALETLPESLLRGLITLLHKGRDRLLLGNYRPITHLNVMYKI